MFKKAVDGIKVWPIMRTTSGAVISENSLEIKELNEKKVDRMADSSRMRRAGRVVVELCWCFGWTDRKRLKEVVDSGL